MAGGYQPLFRTEIGIFVHLAGMSAIGAKFIDFLPKQHDISPLLHYTAYSTVFPVRFLKNRTNMERNSRDKAK